MIAIADTDILSMFGKVKSIHILNLLFKQLFMPTTVYEELLKAKELGFSFVDEVLKRIEVINVNENEHKEYIKMLKNFKQLHKGELMGIVVCKHRNGIFLTNDKKAIDFCKNENILFFDIKGICRALFLRDILTETELRRLASDIKEKDNTEIKGFEQIFIK